MKIQYQVCSLEQANKLKELGVTQRSYYLWQWEENVQQHVLTFKGSAYPNIAIFNEDYCAYSLSELSEMLPTHITYEDDQFFLQIIRGSKRWLAEWHTNKKELSILSDGELDRPRDILWNTYKGNKYLVNVFADWVISLIENKVITADEVNNRILD